MGMQYLISSVNRLVSTLKRMKKEVVTVSSDRVLKVAKAIWYNKNNVRPNMLLAADRSSAVILL